MIDKYKKGELSEAEMEAIEETLLQKLVQKQDEDKLRENLKRIATSLEIETNQNPEATSSSTPTSLAASKATRRRIWLSIAIAAATILGPVALAWLGKQFLKSSWSESAPELALNFLKQESAPSLSNTMNDDSLSTAEQAARTAYIEQRYQKAAQLFAALPPSTAQQHFYLGISALKQEKPNFTLAETHLLQARSFGKGWQEDAINWHLALVYLSTNQASAARKELENIVTIGREHVNQAEMLLIKLEQ
ncbi:MAG: hypothetical protein SFV55_08365 [Haliscomenobacter sp.]|uniref:hypothetical protein n=1 Tax=Haliscomenobacter sp. TaxID=2717303 RepID=UPI0029B76A13|nr:hypothetical protein [Haliscomenobacter sp.]MDX2068426.1 hypothetical protein [Haliscomenobacter sp.]